MKQNYPKYHEWRATHQCKINHTGSSDSMETAGALRIFKRSVVTRELKYKDMLGDGDFSTYSAIVASKPYGEDRVPKLPSVSPSVWDMSRSEFVADYED